MTGIAAAGSLAQPKQLAYGIGVGPLVWALHLLAIYALASLGCAGGGPAPGLHDLSGSRALILAATVVSEVAVVSGGWLAYRHWQRLHAGQQSEPPGAGVTLESFLALSGALLCVYFAVIILLAGVPAVVGMPCQ